MVVRQPLVFSGSRPEGGLAEDDFGGAGAAAEDYEASGCRGIDAAAVEGVVFGGGVGVVCLVGEVVVDEVVN